MGQAWWFTDVYGFGPNVGLMEILSTFHYLNISHLHVTKHRLILGKTQQAIQEKKLKRKVDFFPPTNIKPHHRPVDKKDFQIKPRYQASPTRTHFLEVIPKTKHGEAGRVCRDSLELSQSRKTSVVKTSLPYPEALSPPGLACKRATVN